VTITPPAWGGPGRYVAEIPAGVIPHDPREAVVRAPDRSLRGETVRH